MLFFEAVFFQPVSFSPRAAVLSSPVMSAKTSLHTISRSSFSSASVANCSLRRTSLARRSCTAAATPELRRVSAGGDGNWAGDWFEISRFVEVDGSSKPLVFILSESSDVFLRWKIFDILPMLIKIGI